MSELKKLITQFCPNGVTYKKLSDVAEIQRGKRVVKEQLSNETGYPVFQNSLTSMGFHTESNYPAYTTFIIGAGAAGEIGYSREAFWAADDCYPIICSSAILNRYLYHVIMWLKPQIVSKVRKASIPRLSRSVIENLIIPVPPLEVQREIVRILDNFTELTAELTARKKQYEYYRDMLLTFDGSDWYTTKCDIKWMRIGEITKVFSAARVHKHQWTNQGVPFLRSSDVISFFNGVSNSRGEAFISNELYEELSARSGKAGKGDILITGGGTIGIPYIVPDDSLIYMKDADLLCIKKSEILNERFLYYYFLSTGFRTYLENITHNATIAHYTISQIENTPVPVPAMEWQNQIVQVLDKLDSYCRSIFNGLPAEIAARQKQYEYYRDKLLTFKELT